MKVKELIMSFYLDPPEAGRYEKNMLGDAWAVSRALWLIMIPAILLRNLLVGCMLSALLAGICFSWIRGGIKKSKAGIIA